MASPFRHRWDRRELERSGRAAGLPESIARSVAQAVASTGLGAEHRAEVFEELVSHFQDGLAAGKEADELLASFGDESRAALLIDASKRVLTPGSRGGAVIQLGFLAGLRRDVREAISRLLATPVFTAIAVASLAIGIGANTAIFSVVNEVILRSPPIVEPERLVDVYRSSRGVPLDGLSEADIADFRGLTSVFSGVASTRMTWIWYSAGEDLRLTGEAVSADYFRVLGLQPLLGRFIEPRDAPRPGEGAVVVLGERTWRTVFGSDPGIVGQTVRLNGTDFGVIGVARADYPGRLRAFPTDVFVPVMMIDELEHTSPSQLEDRGNGGTFATFQLQAGVTLRQAQVAVDHLAAELNARGIPQWENQAAVDLIPQAQMIIDPAVDQVLRPVAVMLMLVVGLVLVLACANLTGLLLARAAERREESVTRLASGAKRSRLVAEFLTETVLIGLAAGLVGTLLGRGALSALLASEIPFPIPMDLRLPFDWRVISFSLLISVAAGVASGLMPALQSGSDGHRRVVVRHVLAGAQVAVAMVLLVVAALFARSFDAARRVDPGFGQAPGALAWFGGRPDTTGAALDRLVQETARIPGVEAVGLTSLPHLSPIGSQSIEVAVDGVEPPPGRNGFAIDAAGIDTGYAAAIGLRLLSGRNLTRMDRAARWSAALVNEAFAHQFYPDGAALGQRFSFEGREIEIVGVVNTARIRSLGEAPRPFIYYPGGATMDWLVVRTGGDHGSILTDLRSAVAAADPGFFVAETSTMSHFMASQSYPFKLGALLLMGLAILAVVMASIGVYGSTALTLAQEDFPLGSVARLVWSGGLRIVSAGAGVGVLLALVIGPLLQRLLFQVRPFDPVSLVAMPAVLLGAAFLATRISTRRARLLGATCGGTP